MSVQLRICRAWCSFLGVGVGAPALASGDPIIVVHFGVGALIGLLVLGILLRDWRRARIHWAFLLAFAATVGGVWLFAWHSAHMSNPILGTLLIGVPSAFLLFRHLGLGRKR